MGLLEETTYCLPPGDVDQEEEDEEVPQSSLAIPEDLDSREAMVSWALSCPFSFLPLWSSVSYPLTSFDCHFVPGSQWSVSLSALPPLS
jgi:hypothetical protein